MAEQKQTLTIQKALDLAVQHHKSGRLSDAESLYQQILQTDPDHPIALHLLGVIAHQMGKNDVAVDLITKALALKPDWAEAHSNLGNALQDLGNPEDAVTSFHKALAIKPDYAEAHRNLGLVLQELGRLDESATHYRRASDINPDYADTHVGKRFFNILDRNFSSTLFDFRDVGKYAQIIKYSKWHKFKWKDLILMKDPMTLTIYLQLLQELKPKTIIEFGTFEGGSALWMSDTMGSLGLSCHIHTFDIRAEKVKLPDLENLSFHKLDNFKIRDFVDSNLDLFASLNHPILVVEDSHKNVSELLSCIDEFLDAGDYLIVEDTLDKSKYEKMNGFLLDHEYLVDSYYCDFWGINNSWNINSFLKKT